MNETFRDEKVTYTLELRGRFVLVENVPARVCLQTGERLQSLLWGSAQPKRTIETPVYEFT